MASKVSTGQSYFDINALFAHNGETAKQALTGMFTQELVRTRDYIISLVTFVNYEPKEDEENNFPINGVEYHLETFSDDKVRRFDSEDELIEFVNVYIKNQHSITQIEFELDGIDRSQYTIKDPYANKHGRKLTLTEIGVVIAQVDSFDNKRMSGFIKNDDMTKLQPVFEKMKAKLK